jgi:hypothetical protein
MTFQGHYSWLDRLVHRLAFATGPAQLALADLEDKLYKRELASIRLDRPVFITGLPRAGTTLLLEICADGGEFATHTYRHMPFVLVPMLWRRLSARFWKRSQAIERAHGDGMLVSVDSPESFEEMVWRPFWRAHYKRHRIVPWGREQDEGFTAFFRSHMRKIIALENQTRPAALRYISKNNLNIARLGAIRTVVPDAILVVPFRDPVDHAASLLRQHQNFLALHRKDRFGRQYMARVGHYDFGANLRPIDFDHWLPDGWTRSDRSLDATQLEFWLRYWTAAYSHLSRSKVGAHFVCFEQLCETPGNVLGELAERLGVAPDVLVRSSERVRSAPAPAERQALDPSLVEAARALYATLRLRAVTGAASSVSAVAPSNA